VHPHLGGEVAGGAYVAGHPHAEGVQRQPDEQVPVDDLLERGQPALLGQDDVDAGERALVLGGGVQDGAAAAPRGQQHRGGLPVHRQGHRHQAADGDVELVLEQVGRLGHPVGQGGGRQLDPLTGRVVVVRDQRGRGVAAQCGVEQAVGQQGSGCGHPPTLPAARTVS
jgi:hypothetical protein